MFLRLSGTYVAKINGRICCFLNTFNFSSDTRGHFSNVNTILPSLATWSKMPLTFLKDDGLVTYLSGEMCQRGLILKHKYLGTLIVK